MSASVFDKLRKRNRNTSETFAIEVSGYGKTNKGVEYVEGKRIDTGEAVSVFLRQLPKEDQSRSSKEFSRPEIKEIKKKVETGGILRVDSAFKQGEMYSARWLSVISKKPGHGAAVVLPARVLPVSYYEEDDRKFQNVEMLVPKGAMPVSDRKSFDDALIKALGPEYVKEAGLPSNTVPLAVIRMVSKMAPEDSFHITVRARRVRLGDGEDDAEWRTLYGADAMANVSDRTQELLDEVRSEFLESEDVEITIVPGGMLYFGPRSVNDDHTRGFELSYPAINRDGETVERKAYLFRQAVVGLRSVESAPEDKFVISAVPVRYNSPMSRDGIDWYDKETWVERLQVRSAENPSQAAEQAQTTTEAATDPDAADDMDDVPDFGDDEIPDFGDDVEDLAELDDQELEDMVNTVREKREKRQSKSASLSI